VRLDLRSESDFGLDGVGTRIWRLLEDGGYLKAVHSKLVTLVPGQRQAMQTLIRHTVAARLFDRPLLAAHLDFCAEAAARIPVRRLAYPHRREVLPQVRDAIRRSMFQSPGTNGRHGNVENTGN